VWGLIDRALYLAMWIAIAGSLYGTVLLVSGLRVRHL